MAAFEFVVNLKDGVSDKAKAAADQMAVLTKSAAATRNALTKADALGDINKHKALTKQLATLNAAQSVIPKGLLKEVEAHKASAAAALAASKQKIAAEKAQIKASAAAAKSAGKTSAAPSGGGGLGSANAELAEMTGGISAVIEVAVAAAAAIGVVVVAGMAMAIEAAEAKEKMIALFDALGEGKISGKQTVEMLNGLSEKIGIAKSELAPLTTEFMKMGVTGKEALESLTLAAISAKALGGGTEAAAAAFMGLEKKIQLAAATGQKMKNPLKSMAEFGITVDDVAAKMGVTSKVLASGLKAGTVDAAKFGEALQKAVIEKGAGPLEKMGASFENVKKMFMDNIGKMFEDIDVGPFLAQIKDLFSIFGQAKPSGQALKSGIGGFFKMVFDQATKVVPMVKHFFLDLIILGLKAYIGLKPIIKWFKELQQNKAVMDFFIDNLKTVGNTLLVIGVVVGVIIAVVVALGVALFAVSIAIVQFGLYLLGLVNGAAQTFQDWIASAATMAYDFVKGLVNGITSGAGMVVDAVKGLANGAKNAFKSALGINSPSKVMMEMGGHAASGVAEGLDAGASDVHVASSGLAAATTGGFASGGGGGGKASGGGGGATFEAGSIVINGAGMGAMEITEEMLGMVWERMSLGAGV